MPFNSKSAKRHNKAVGGDKEASKVWAKVANKSLKHYKGKGDKQAEGKAIATASKVANKVLKRKKNESFLLRDDKYGGLGLVFEGDSFVTYDHGFDQNDFNCVLSILEDASGSPGQFRPDGGCVYEASQHPMSVVANVKRAMAFRGYTSDVLSARAIINTGVYEAMSPPLPTGRSWNTDDSFDAGMRREINKIMESLASVGTFTPPTVSYRPRGNDLDSYGRPLPFVVARSFFRGDSDSVTEALFDKLKAHRVVRATVGESVGGIAPVEFALAPTVQMFESMTRGAHVIAPSFNYKNHERVRKGFINLTSSINEQELEDIESLAKDNDGVIGLELDDSGMRLIGHFPSFATNENIDHAFKERVDWLCEMLEPWGAELEDFGESLDEMDFSRSARRTRADPDDIGAQHRALRGKARAGHTISPSELKRLADRAVGFLKKDGHESDNFRLPNIGHGYVLRPDPGLLYSFKGARSSKEADDKLRKYQSTNLYRIVLVYPGKRDARNAMHVVEGPAFVFELDDDDNSGTYSRDLDKVLDVMLPAGIMVVDNTPIKPQRYEP